MPPTTRSTHLTPGVDLLAEHHALVHPEVMSRISETYYLGSGENIGLTTAPRDLHATGVIRSAD